MRTADISPPRDETASLRLWIHPRSPRKLPTRGIVAAKLHPSKAVRLHPRGLWPTHLVCLLSRAAGRVGLVRSEMHPWKAR